MLLQVDALVNPSTLIKLYMHYLQFGPIRGLTWRIYPSAFVGTLILFLLLSGVAVWGIGMSLWNTVLTGVICTVLFWLSDIVHNYGHGRSGVTLGWGCAADVVRLVAGLATSSLAHSGKNVQG